MPEHVTGLFKRAGWSPVVPCWSRVYTSGYWSPQSLLKASCWNSLCHSVLHPTVSYIFSFDFIFSINSKELGKIYLLYLLGSLGSLLPKDLTEEMFWDKGLSRYSVTPRFFWSFELGAIQNGEWGQFLSPTYFVISNSNSHNSIHISIMVLFSVWDVPRNRFRVLLTKYAACSHRKL